MDRRGFLKAGIGVTVAGAAASSAGLSAAEAAHAAEASPTVEGAKPAPGPAAAILSSFSAADHRRRLENIARCEQGIRRCLGRHLVTDYLPGQSCYNLGEYPGRKPYEPGEEDERELDRLRDHGIRLIQVFDDWNDSLRLFGGDKYTAVNPAGFRRFVEMVHRRGMKLLAYASTCFLQRTDPDFRPEWAREGDNCVVGYWNMARCSPASPGWRAFLLPRVTRILDDYGVDGLYIDGGYVSNVRKRITAPAKDEVAAFRETPEYDGAFADLLALMHAEVKRRGGIFKLHVDGADAPRSGGLKVYDYLWVGEGVGNADKLREAVKNHPPYVVPCIDLSFAKVEDESEAYLHSIPYLQFPVLQAGRPFTGERGMAPGVAYNGDDFWVRRCRQVWEHYQKHPEGPFTYGGWDAFPARAETRPTHARWLARYLPLVEEGTWAWLELADTNLLTQPLPSDVVASAFANRELYLVLANYGTKETQVETADPCVALGSPGSAIGKRWTIPARSLVILRRAA
jgi:hypothetical protein